MYVHAQLYVYVHGSAHPSLSSLACYTFFALILHYRASGFIKGDRADRDIPNSPPPPFPCLHHLAQTLATLNGLRAIARSLAPDPLLYGHADKRNYRGGRGLGRRQSLHVLILCHGRGRQ